MDIFQNSLSQLCFQHTPAAVAVLDMDMRYLAVSDRWIEDYDLQGVDVIGRTHYEIFPNLPERWKDIHQRCLTGEIMSCDADPFSRDDGGIDWVRWEIRPWFKEKSVMAGIVMFTEVITAVKNLEFMNKDLKCRVDIRTQEIEKIKSYSEQACQAKAEFISRMSHELRTPLNVILGFTQILQMDNALLSDEHKDAVENIIKSGHHLLELVNDVLDLEKMNAGKLKLDIQPVALGDVLTEVNDQIARQAKDAGVNYISGSLDNLPDVMADVFCLKEILINLLSNGIKYNKNNGSLIIQVSSDVHDYVRVDVIDTGMGIDDGRIDHIFEPFNQGALYQDDISGTGVGLALIKKYAELMNCEIGVESEVDKGSRFWISIPVVRQVSVAS
ncbi:MAG: PAS domain-containing sensor histidine kinase [Gammaproteobacteria bacterium]|nr:PAS domain-containing sensor histidine kinase [Gammaproteobacteria bacterium]MCW9055195.1 PAS domain-containing sensor histidine kinase [Gammaproteobacteria bacterium]